VSETKAGYQSAGLTAEAPHGEKLPDNLTHGNEPPAMLLALLNSAVISMANSQQAQIMGQCTYNGRKASVIFVFDAVPTKDGLVMETANNE
jgi:hypothetical protein